MSEEQTEHETGGLSFAVTLLAALGTIIYVAYAYLQTTPVDPLWYLLVCNLMGIAVILGLGLLLYLLIKGYSMEVQDPKERGNLAKRASHIYLVVLLMFIVLSVFSLCVFLVVLLKIELTIIISLVISLISVLIGTVFALYLLREKIPSKKLLSGVLIAECVLFIGLPVLGVLVPAIVYSPLQGHVTVDMEDIYCKNDEPIPVLIHVTGPNTNITVFLVNEFDDTLRQIDDITLYPEYLSYHISHGKYLFGNTVEYGRYVVFINTTDLAPGYYELHCWRWLSWKTSSGHSFYLVNSSQQPSIEVVNTS